MNILITGIAGFIGLNLAKHLNSLGHDVAGIDNLKSSYNHPIQLDRNQHLKEMGIKVLNEDLREIDFEELNKSLGFEGEIDVFIHLAGWPGVLRSVNEPEMYYQNNVDAFMYTLKAVNKLKPKKFFYASSSSVYGDLASNMACREDDQLPKPLNFYALTKQIDELLADQYPMPHTRVCGLRFFTVFGAWGRPDMAYWKFAESILKKQTIELRGESGGWRDFTSVNDLVRVIEILCETDFELPPIVNMAKGESRPTSELVKNLEKCFGIPAQIKIIERPTSEASTTLSDASLLNKILDKFTWTDFEDATVEFADWFREYS
jgi:UDP-glucuronate 4-epimerase